MSNTVNSNASFHVDLCFRLDVVKKSVNVILIPGSFHTFTLSYSIVEVMRST